MKTKLGLSVGLATGSALYDLIMKGIDGVDLYKAAFMAVFCFTVFLFIPNRLLEKKQTESK